MSRWWPFVFVLLFLSLTACKKEAIQDNDPRQRKTYLHLSHTREVDNPNILPGVNELNFDDYDLLLLGGDLGQNTSENPSSMVFYDQLFNFASSKTLWTLGNHDYEDTMLVSSFTSRPTYYAYHENGITFIVLDTQMDSSNISGAQLNYVLGVLDTMQTSSHCLLLHHKLMWHPELPHFNADSVQLGNGELGDCHWCLNPENNFYEVLYPELVAVEKRGVQVLLVGGDFGNQVSSFSYKTTEGIQILGSGLTYLDGGRGEYLVFRHYPKVRHLEWRFETYTP